MKKIIAILILMFQCAIPLYAESAEPLDQIVALVNDDVVTRNELNKALEDMKRQFVQEQVPLPSTAEMTKRVLDQMINKKLQLQMVQQAGIAITETDVNKAITNIASQNHVTTKTLFDRVHSEGMTSKQYRKEIKDQIALRKLQQQEMMTRLTVSQQEIDHYKRSQPWKNEGAKEYRVEDILVSLSDSPTPTEINTAKEQAQSLLSKLKDGTKTADLQKGNIQVNDLGLRKLGELPSAFADSIARMSANSYAGPIQTGNGFHILRLDEVKSLAGDSVQLTRKQIEDLLLQRKFEEAVQTMVSKLRSQAYIVINKA